MVPEFDAAGVETVDVAVPEDDGNSVGRGRPVVVAVDEGLTVAELVGLVVVHVVVGVVVVGVVVALVMVGSVGVPVALVPVLEGLAEDELWDIWQAARARRACWACFFLVCSVRWSRAAVRRSRASLALAC